MDIDKFLGCILGVAVGDALGMPFETMNPEEMKQVVSEFGDIEEYLSPSINPHAFPETKSLLPGSWTDDTQLTIATMDALIESGAVLDMDIVAQKHVSAYQESKLGWGKATRNAIERLAKGASWKDSGEPTGSGNGIMMKIAPLGLLQSIECKTNKEFMQLCIDFGKMTHGTTPAIVAGCVHAKAIAILAANDPIKNTLSLDVFIEELLDFALKAESLLPDVEEKISGQIIFIDSLLKNKKLYREDYATLSGYFGGGKKKAFSALNSFGVSYASFFRHRSQFDCVSQVLLAGGDTDSNASIVGSLVGSCYGINAIPTSLIKNLRESKEIASKTIEFYKVVNDNRE